jgi:hypothetical protein
MLLECSYVFTKIVWIAKSKKNVNFNIKFNVMKDAVLNIIFLAYVLIILQINHRVFSFCSYNRVKRSFLVFSLTCTH